MRQTSAKDAALPAIAPRYRTKSENYDPQKPARLTLARPRLPPRSRFGCWTCRTRKVKCDEARPECTPCARLGHTCDYNPRLSFKDDTPRVVEKISGRGGGVGPVWKTAGANTFKRQRLDRDEEDLLPSFSSLTNDDARERKAQFKPLGTYNVVVNTESFQGIEEYRGTFYEDPETLAAEPTGRSSPTRTEGRPTLRADSSSCSDESDEESNDPDIVILKVFEDDALKCLSPTSYPPRTSQLSRTETLSTTSASTLGNPPNVFQFTSDNTPLVKYARPDGSDHAIIFYYRSFVHRHLAQVHRDTLGTASETGSPFAPDVFETQASNFLPLFHALMAFSALSMAQKDGIPSLDALQHYQQALPLLKSSIHSEEDLASDGVFLTHFILLLYEIAAGGPRGLSLWGQHISQLQRITLLRRELYSIEPFSFIVWWVANIDTHVLLSGLGNGDFVETMLRHQLLPTGMTSDSEHAPARYLSPLIDEGALPSTLAFHRHICVLAAKAALLARDLRDEARMMLPHHPNPNTLQQWQQRIGVLQDILRRTWNVQMPASVANGYCNQLLPVGARGVFEHTFALYRALIIYSHTSMYPSQRTHRPSHSIHEVAQSAGEILRLGREIVGSQHVERKFIVFPLFMAGSVNKHPIEKAEILGLLRSMEEDSVGRNMIATRQLLEIVYERQGRRKVEGREDDVDWVAMIGELGLQVVNCRL